MLGRNKGHGRQQKMAGGEAAWQQSVKSFPLSWLPESRKRGGHGQSAHGVQAHPGSGREMGAGTKGSADTPVPSITRQPGSTSLNWPSETCGERVAHKGVSTPGCTAASTHLRVSGMKFWTSSDSDIIFCLFVQSRFISYQLASLNQLVE